MSDCDLPPLPLKNIPQLKQLCASASTCPAYTALFTQAKACIQAGDVPLARYTCYSAIYTLCFYFGSQYYSNAHKDIMADHLLESLIYKHKRQNQCEQLNVGELEDER